MSLVQFLKNLVRLPDPNRRPEPEGPVTSEDHAREIETEKERRKGGTGF